ncbi:MAG: ComEC/Rec2 family competence protein [Bryobacteraceae bacterium]
MSSREPLLLPAAAFGFGVLIANLIYFTLADLRWPTLEALVLLAGVLTFNRSRKFGLLPTLLLFSIGGVATQVIHRQGPPPVLSAGDSEMVILSGCVVNPPVFSPNREQFTVELAPNARARISTSLKEGEKLALGYGQNVELAAKVRRPRNYQNPDSFDYASFLAAQHIYWTAAVKDIGDIHPQPGSCGSVAPTWLFEVRTWALNRLTSLYPGDQHTAGMLQAILLGETSGVERRWTNDFRLTGTYHAIVISGQHIAVLAFSLLLIFRLFQLRRIPALGLATIACWLYACLSGMGSPVVRAAGGFTLFLIASYCFRRTRILNILAAVALVYLIFDPTQLFDPSFQLSFLSAAAIAAFAIPLMESGTEPVRAAVKRFDQPSYDPMVETHAAAWRVELRLLAETLHLWSPLSKAASVWLVEKATRIVVFIAEAVIVTACVQFGLALPMIAYFHRLSLTGLSANVVVVPLLSLVIPLGFASILTNSHALAALTRMLLSLAESITSWHVQFEPQWRIAAIPFWIAIAFSVSLVVLAFAIRRQNRNPAQPESNLIAACAACALGLLGLILWQPWDSIRQLRVLEVSAIDVSQGDSLLVVFPDGKTMLIDAGGFPGMGRMVRKPQLDVGEDVVSPYLWSRRIHHLDYCVLTHGHSDHMDGLPSILDNFHPRLLWIGAEPDSAEWRNVKQHARADGVVIEPRNRASPPVVVGGARVRFLAPSPDYQPGDAAVNNDSLVIEIAYGRRSVLLTGDAEAPIENDMVASGVLQPVTLLKVGHHGSKTSSSEDFITALAPRFAFISDGYMNQFHHPNPGVLTRLADHHVTVFRTDQQGLLTFRTDGDKVEIQTFR